VGASAVAVRGARRLANGAVAGVLRSPAHRLLSRWLLLLTYRGRRSGRSYTIPLLYARDGGDFLLVALHPGGQLWWRSLTGGAAVEVRVAGRSVNARAAGAGDHAAARRAFAAARPWAAPLLRRPPAALFVRVSPRV
jgi:deazaflavin-dependent oxidoreductase (nitroreductase family)